MVYDAVIIGAGLAGLTLARQLLLNDAQMTLAIIHDGTFPNAHAAHKVGESTVEIGGFYLRETLALKEYLENEHLPKMGLRFMQTDGATYREYGIDCFPYHDAYQLDRGKLENDLYNALRSQVTIMTGERFLKADMRDDGLHCLESITKAGETKQYQARWLIDASGRQRTMVKALGAGRSSPLTHSAVWFRVDARIDVNDFLASDDDENIFYGAQRHYSTIHLVGSGYWVWIIPLPEGRTSLGIVFDETLHDARALLRLEDALAWLEQHETALFSALPAKENVLDFKYLRKYSYNSDLFLSLNRMAVTGEAKGFVDPLYSNGTDFIAFMNTMITETILHDRQGGDIQRHSDIYNRFLHLMYECFQTCHVHSYKNFDQWHYVTAKTDIDPIFYFGTFCVVFMNKKVGDLDFMEEALFLLEDSFASYKKIISLFKSDDFARAVVEVPRYLSIIGSIQEEVNRNILLCHDDGVMALLRENKRILDFVRQSLENGEDFYTISRIPSRQTRRNGHDTRYAWLP